MNSFERYMRTVRGQPTDILPRVPILMQFAAEYIGSDYGTFAASHHVLTEANVRCAADFGIDQLSTISDPYRETQGFGGAITYVADGPPRCTHPLAASKDLDVLPRPDPLTGERMRDRIRAVETYTARFQGQLSILGWIEGPAAEAAALRGVMPFLYDLLDDPAFAADLMDRCVEAGIAFARAQIAAGADTVGIGDALASQVHPRTYERLIQPREQQLVDAIHAAGALAKLHICGNITHLLPGIAALGVDILDVDHMVGMRAVRDALGHGVVLTGNLDPVSAIRNGTPAAIRDAVEHLYDQTGNPAMVNAGCEIPSGTPPANLRALCAPVPCRA